MTLSASGDARLVLSVATHSSVADADDELVVMQGGDAVVVSELRDAHGNRIHVCDVTQGEVSVRYRATVTGRATPQSVTPLDEVTFLRPSRYCEADELVATATRQFAGLTGTDLVAGVSSWVGTHLDYVPGSSLPTDGAVRTLLSGKGVCRDYAHLVVALMRALDVPARLVSVYAPGLTPMDFHAVAEIAVDGLWRVVDATALAPRSSLVRIATGRDAADTAFLSIHGAFVGLTDLTVSATADALPNDDVRELVSLG